MRHGSASRSSSARISSRASPSMDVVAGQSAGWVPARPQRCSLARLCGAFGPVSRRAGAVASWQVCPIAKYERRAGTQAQWVRLDPAL
jgi:hypothetical protein